jgi:K(+)-stimulated pyrophosphate-energized sodium pump
VVSMSALSSESTPLRYLIAGIAVAVIIAAVTISTRRPVAIADSDVVQAAIAPPSEPAVPVEETVVEELKQPEPKPIK